MKTINEIELQLRINELERSVTALENKISNVKESISKNIGILKKHHNAHLEMVKENPDSVYFQGLASESKFQLDLAQMNEEYILQILLYF